LSTHIYPGLPSGVNKEIGINAMSLVGIIPDDLFDPDRKDDVIVQLRILDIPPRRKKNELAGWAQAVGAGLTAEDYRKLLGADIERV
tara:strand:+ start:924 stop:1184 length:261 start_codon:yes stop_codon:yes gene_type:complete